MTTNPQARKVPRNHLRIEVAALRTLPFIMLLSVLIFSVVTLFSGPLS